MAGKLTKWTENVQLSSTVRPSKICPNWEFWNMYVDGDM
jgi:hypothetical protein